MSLSFDPNTMNSKEVLHALRQMDDPATLDALRVAEMERDPRKTILAAIDARIARLQAGAAEAAAAVPAPAPPAPPKVRKAIGIREYQTSLGYVRKIIYEDE